MMRTLLAVLVAGLVAIMLAPAGESHVGFWWRARDLPATSLGMGVDHTLHPTSTATDLRTGQVYNADVQWSGQQFQGAFGTLFNGLLTLKFFDDVGLVVHQATIGATETNPEVKWVQCPAGTGDSNWNLETVPEYSLVAPGILDLKGVTRNSFCGNFNDPNDPFYFRNFSDYEATYLPDVGGSATYALHLHVRMLDHG